MNNNRNSKDNNNTKSQKRRNMKREMKKKTKREVDRMISLFKLINVKYYENIVADIESILKEQELRILQEGIEESGDHYKTVSPEDFYEFIFEVMTEGKEFKMDEQDHLILLQQVVYWLQISEYVIGDGGYTDYSIKLEKKLFFSNELNKDIQFSFLLPNLCIHAFDTIWCLELIKEVLSQVEEAEPFHLRFK